MALGRIVYLCGLICYCFQLHFLDLHSVSPSLWNWSKVCSECNKPKLIVGPHYFPAVHSHLGFFKAVLQWLLVFVLQSSFSSLQCSCCLSLLSSILKRLVLLILWNPDFKEEGLCIGTLYSETLSRVETELQPWPAALQMQATGHKGNQMKDRWIR